MYALDSDDACPKSRTEEGRRITPVQRASCSERKETVPELAQRHQVALCTLLRWRHQFGRIPRRRLLRAPVFQEIPVVAGLSSWTAEVRLPDGVQLRWNPSDILQKLRQPC